MKVLSPKRTVIPSLYYILQVSKIDGKGHAWSMWLSINRRSGGLVIVAWEDRVHIGWCRYRWSGSGIFAYESLVGNAENWWGEGVAGGCESWSMSYASDGVRSVWTTFRCSGSHLEKDVLRGERYLVIPSGITGMVVDYALWSHLPPMSDAPAGREITLLTVVTRK